MDERILEFVAALRAAGLRISIAESLDALRAVEQTGIAEPALLRATLRATLVKTHSDLPSFERLFPLYFGGSGVAFVQPGEEAALSPAEQGLLDQALQVALTQAPSPELARIFTAIASGQPLQAAQLAALLAHLGPPPTSSPIFQPWMARRALRELQFEQLEVLLRALLEQLRAAGLRDTALAALEQSIRLNQAAQAEQIGRAVGLQMQRQAATARERTDPRDTLLDRPFHLLDTGESEALRGEVARLAAQLRTQAALRRRRARRGALDPRSTLRASLRYGGIPFELRHRRRRLTPRLVVLCDLSSSMRAVASFMLLLVHALHDQMRRTRSFAYIDELYDISADFHDARPAVAVAAVLGRISADYARTNMGIVLDQFVRSQLSRVDRRTTVLILGDGRNNRNDPGLAELKQIRAYARRLIWFTPESPRDWAIGDCDMLAYAPLCDSVHVVRNLRQLAAAVERLVLQLS